MNLLRNIDQPLAIAMWDTSWIRRHDYGGSFENWDRVLDELVERGYNAVRIDPHPHMVADGPDGERVERFRCIPNRGHQTYATAMWGNPWTITIEPRQALVDFIPKCVARGVQVGLATWFKSSEDGRFEQIEGEDGLVRVWDETLAFLEANSLLRHIIFVDVLNEYPGQDFTWLHRMLATMAWPYHFNDRQIGYYRAFMQRVLQRLKIKWPQLTLLASQNKFHDLEGTDYSAFDAIDYHLWAIQNKEIFQPTGYFATIARHGKPGNTDTDYVDTYAKLIHNWHTHRDRIEQWLEQIVRQIADLGAAYDIPVGSTEGWGAYNWTEHPALRWDWIQAAGEIGARLGVKYGYTFNCSSNFTHPQFKRLWDDIAWHRKVTAIIKSGRPRQRMH